MSSTTSPATKIRRASDEIEAEPGFFEVGTVAHCGPVLKGEFARTVNMTDVLTGWTFTRSIRNNAEKHIISALDAAVDAIPFPVLGMDFDNGSEFINHGVVRWAGNLDIYFTRSRPYRKNDQATIETREATTWCAATPSTTATTPTPSARCSTACGSWSTSESTS